MRQVTGYVIAMVSRGVLRLALLLFAIPLMAPAIAACRKKPVGTTTLDASADAETADGAASFAAAEAGAPSASAAASAKPTPTIAPMFEGMPAAPPTPFAGSYKCLKGLSLVQTGSIVTGTVHTSGSVDTIIACTAGPDTCTGTVREIQQMRGKPPKVMHVKQVTLRRAPNGDIVIKPETGAETFCRKS